MSYLYRTSYEVQTGKASFDALMTTKKGHEDGIPYGVIIPTGYIFSDKKLSEFITSTDYPVYITKHCDSVHEVTHIVPAGIVNRFGAMISAETVLSVKADWNLDIGAGAFKRVPVQDVAELKALLKSLEKKSKA